MDLRFLKALHGVYNLISEKMLILFIIINCMCHTDQTKGSLPTSITVTFFTIIDLDFKWPCLFSLIQYLQRESKKINTTLSVRVIKICSDHKLLWRDSYKGVGRTSTSPESILYKIIII